ncbi:SurA N-terminal domain-containing protein, partial [bacterium]|nr:SurA N-terminal domain-containing protein [bacterium]
MKAYARSWTRGAGAIALAVLAVGAGPPRPSAAEEIDRIVAVVGSEIILLSELDEEVYLAHLREQLDLENADAVSAYRHEVLDSAVEGKLLLEEARRQGLRVTREEVDRAVDGMLDDVRGRFPSEEDFQRQLASEGSSVEALRKGYRAKLQEQLLVRQLVDRAVRSRVSVPESEIRDYWDSHRSEVAEIPELLHLRRILVALSGTAGADSAAVERMNIVRSRLEGGEDFATLARVFSEGPAASSGGRLGWFHVEDLEPVLADAVRGRDPGYVTPVVVTDRGAHVLRVGDRRENGQLELSQIVFLRDE